MKKTQKARLLDALTQGPLTTLEIINRLGIVRPAAVVLLLKQDGWNVTTEMVKVLNRYKETCSVAKYTLDPQDLTTWKSARADQLQPVPVGSAWEPTLEDQQLADQLEAENPGTGGGYEGFVDAARQAGILGPDPNPVRFDDLYDLDDLGRGRDVRGADETGEDPPAGSLDLF